MDNDRELAIGFALNGRDMRYMSAERVIEDAQMYRDFLRAHRGADHAGLPPRNAPVKMRQ